MSNIEQTYRIEIRFDFTGTKEAAEAAAQKAANLVGQSAEVTAIMDENFDDV